MPPFLTSKNRKLRIKLTPLVTNADEQSSLLADVAAGASTITIESINKFAVNKILLIGELGSEQSEIIKTHASSAPSGSTVTLASNLVFAHKAGTRVYIIQYDQVELSHSTTATGSKTNLTTTLGTGLVALEADEKEMVYDETEQSTGFYHARFKNSISGVFGSYSDAVPSGAFDEDSVAHVIEYALSNSKVEDFNDSITRNWCHEQITDCLRYVQGKQKRWNKYQNLNARIGTTARGTRTVAMPSNIYDPYSNRSLTGIRIGDEIDLIYKDPDEFEDLLRGENVTTVGTEGAIGATSLVVVDSNDFEDTGTITAYIDGEQIDVTYTGITRSTHTITGIPSSGAGSITATLTVGTNVYQGYTEGEPRYYTVRNQLIEYFPGPDALNDDKNIFADYWTEANAVNSDGDTLDQERFDMVKYWLTWKMRAMDRNDGKLDYKDGDYMMFSDRLKDAIVFKGSLMKHKMSPKINSISMRRHGRTRSRYSNS